MREEEIFVAVVTMFVFGGLAVLWMAMTSRRAVREMEHRERLAMIQRGLVPAPESDPLGFEAAVQPFGPDLRSERWRTAGTMSIGLGLALAILLAFAADDWSIGFGIGGAFTVLGIAILLNGLQLRRSRPIGRPYPHRPYAVGSTPPGEPPSSMAP